jgi:diadenylate cyclase
MDGAIILDQDCTEIVRAAVHLVPDPSIPTDESGTRHRTAERINKQVGYPVISVSQSMRSSRCTSTAGATSSRAPPRSCPGPTRRWPRWSGTAAPGRGQRHAVRARDRGSGHRPRRRRGGPAAGDGAADRPGDRERYAIELGSDGRMLTLQLDELTGGVESNREPSRGLPAGRPAHPYGRRRAGRARSAGRDRAARCRPGQPRTRVRPRRRRARPHRQPARLPDAGQDPRLPRTVIDRLTEHFGSLQKLLAPAPTNCSRWMGSVRRELARSGMACLGWLSRPS